MPPAHSIVARCRRGMAAAYFICSGLVCATTSSSPLRSPLRMAAPQYSARLPGSPSGGASAAHPSPPAFHGRPRARGGKASWPERRWPERPVGPLHGPSEGLNGGRPPRAIVARPRERPPMSGQRRHRPGRRRLSIAAAPEPVHQHNVRPPRPRSLEGLLRAPPCENCRRPSLLPNRQPHNRPRRAQTDPPDV